MANKREPLKPNKARSRDKRREARKEYEARRANEKVNSQYVTEGSDEDARVKAMMERLQNQHDNLVTSLTDYKTQGNFWIAQKDAERIRNANSMNRMWNRRMLLICMSPLEQGFNPGNILEAVGMYAGLAASNPDARRQVQRGAGKLLGSLAHEFELRKGQDSPMGQKLRDMSEKYLRASNFGRLPLNAETAAIQHVSLIKETYDGVRDGRIKADEVMTQFKDAENTLLEMARRDGVSEEDIIQQEHVIVGRMCRADKTNAKYFGEIMYDNVKPDKAHHVRDLMYDKDGNPKVVNRLAWTGEYLDSDGKRFNKLFSPRGQVNEARLAREWTDVVLEGEHELGESGMEHGDAAEFMRRKMLNMQPLKSGVKSYDERDAWYDEQAKIHEKDMEVADAMIDRMDTMCKDDGMSASDRATAAMDAYGRAQVVDAARSVYRQCGESEDGVWMVKQASGFASLLAQMKFSNDEKQNAVTADAAIMDFTSDFGRGLERQALRSLGEKYGYKPDANSASSMSFDEEKYAVEEQAVGRLRKKLERVANKTRDKAVKDVDAKCEARGNEINDDFKKTWVKLENELAGKSPGERASLESAAVLDFCDKYNVALEVNEDTGAYEAPDRLDEARDMAVKQQKEKLRQKLMADVDEARSQADLDISEKCNKFRDDIDRDYDKARNDINLKTNQMLYLTRWLHDGYSVSWQARSADHPTATLDAARDCERSVCQKWMESCAETDEKGCPVKDKDGNVKIPQNIRDTVDKAEKLCNPKKNQRLWDKYMGLFESYGGVPDAATDRQTDTHINKETQAEKEAREKAREDLHERNVEDRGKVAEDQFATIFDNVEPDDMSDDHQMP